MAPAGVEPRHTDSKSELRAAPWLRLVGSEGEGRELFGTPELPPTRLEDSPEVEHFVRFGLRHVPHHPVRVGLEIQELIFQLVESIHRRKVRTRRRPCKRQTADTFCRVSPRITGLRGEVKLRLA
jgi:hypothetical protein